MLGEFIRSQLEEPCVLSTQFLDAVKKYWVRKSEFQEVTLDKKDPIWKEWWIGASSISKACPRLYGLMSACDPSKVSVPSLECETLFNFGVGSAYHKMIQEQVMSTFPSGMVVGMWEQYSDGKIVNTTNYKNELPVGMSLERGWGPKPDGHGWRYSEPKIRIPEYRMVVKLDGIIKWDDEEEVIEIKTDIIT
jgi:hypothetical protein